MNLPDFSDSERKLVAQILLERYGHPVTVEEAEVELQLAPPSEQLTTCPTLYWNELGAEFIVSKVPGPRYRCLFFYSANEQFGTGRESYDNLGDCVITLLRLQADHHATRAAAINQAMPGRTAAVDQDQEYDGPLVI